MTGQSRARPGGAHRLWGYGYEALSSLFGVAEQTIRQWARRGVFDPSDLQSICDRAALCREAGKGGSH